MAKTPAKAKAPTKKAPATKTATKPTAKTTKKAKPAPTATATAPAAPAPVAAVASATTAAAAPATPAAPKEKAKPADFAGFMQRLAKATDSAKLQKATSMLRAESFKLFAKVADDHLVGVVKSQTNSELVYSCRLAKDGNYACCTQNLNICGGLRGSPCKHLLVLLVGLAKAGELDPATAHDWTQASRRKSAVLDKDVMAATFLQYKGAEAGEVDWRPTETIPEDFYAM